jgi:hypothetical protein
MHLFATLTPEKVLEAGKTAYFKKPSQAVESPALVGR